MSVRLEPAERQAILSGLNSDFLHNVAILIVLFKAYRILIEYMRYRHIDIKFIVEIAIIACILELLFNYNSYSQDMRLVMLGLAVSFFDVYAFKYETILKSKIDSQKEMLKEAKARK